MMVDVVSLHPCKEWATNSTVWLSIALLMFSNVPSQSALDVTKLPLAYHSYAIAPSERLAMGKV